MYCGKCGVENPDDNTFCYSCGKPLSKGASVAQNSASVAAAPAIDADPPTPAINEPDPPTIKPATSTVESAESAVPSLEQELHARAADPAVQSGADEQAEIKGIRSSPKASAPSRWARLGIFLLVGLVSAGVVEIVFRARGNSREVVRHFMSASLSLGLVGWGLSNLVGRWLTLTRTWIAAIAVFGVAFLSLSVLMSGELAVDRVKGKVAELEALSVRMVQVQNRDYKRPQDYVDVLLQLEPDIEIGKRLLTEVTPDLQTINAGQRVPLEERQAMQNLINLMAKAVSLKDSEIAVAHEIQNASGNQQEYLFKSKLFPLIERESELRGQAIDFKDSNVSETGVPPVKCNSSGAAVASTHNAAPLSSMLGKSINNAQIKVWLSELGACTKAVINRFDDSYYYSFKSEGISLCFSNPDNRLTAIILYSEGADHFRQYKGDLPFGLSFQLTRREVESILGQPEEFGGNGVIEYWTRYSSKGIGVTYKGKGTSDLDLHVHEISIY